MFAIKWQSKYDSEQINSVEAFTLCSRLLIAKTKLAFASFCLIFSINKA